MKQKQTLLTAALVLLLSACSTTKTVTPAPEPPAAEETAPVVSPVFRNGVSQIVG